jgi:hypothetical protein
MRKYLSVILAAILSLGALPAMAQATQSNTASAQVTYTLGESVTLTLTGGPFTQTGPQWFNLVTLGTTWQLASGHTANQAILWAWFSNTTALTGPAPILASAVNSVFDANAVTACGLSALSAGNGAAPSGGVNNAYCKSITLTANPATVLNLTTPETHTFGLQLQNTPTLVGTYTGTMNFAVVVN